MKTIPYLKDFVKLDTRMMSNLKLHGNREMSKGYYLDISRSLIFSMYVIARSWQDIKESIKSIFK